MSLRLPARIAAAVWLAAAVSVGQPVASARGGSRIVDTRVHSSALEGNLIGDPAERRVAVYLPPSYDTEPSKHYPVLYFLHGFGSDDQVPELSALFRRLMDERVKAGGASEMLVVVPNGRNAYSGSFWANSSVTGRWEDFVAHDLVAWTDAHFRTLPRASSRGLAGHSMGGYGSLLIAMDHPDVFGAVYALSACCLAMEGDLGPTQNAWHRAMKLSARPELKEESTMDDFWVAALVGMSAAFTPDPAGPPLFVVLPYREENRTLVPNGDAYAAFQSKLAINLIPAHISELLRLRGIVVDVGIEDEFSHIPAGTLAFSRELAEHGIPHVFELYRGDHNQGILQRVETRLLPFMARMLDFGESGP